MNRRRSIPVMALRRSFVLAPWRLRRRSLASAHGHVGERPRVQEHLDDVDDREQRERHEHEQVDGAGDVVSAEQLREERQLHRLVHGEAGEDDERRRREDRRVREPLHPVVQADRRRGVLAQPEIVEDGPPRVPGVPAREEQPPPPLPAREEVRDVDERVRDEQPREREVPVARTREPHADREGAGRRCSLERIPAVQLSPRAEEGIGDQDLEPAPGHDANRKTLAQWVARMSQGCAGARHSLSSTPESADRYAPR